MSKSASRRSRKPACPALVPVGAQVRGPQTDALVWRVGRQMGEGTFSRIYHITPITTGASKHPQNGRTSSSSSATPPAFPCVLKVNKFPPPQSDVTHSFHSEARVWREVQARQQQMKRARADAAFSIPLIVDHQSICLPDVSCCASASPPIPIEYLVLERCGVDFSALRDSWQSVNGGVGEPLAALQFGQMALRALEQFHAAGYVHRDIKPSNFLTLHHDAPDVHSRILVTDFGLSRTREELDEAPAGAPAHRTVGKSLYSSFTSHHSRAQTPRDDVVSLLFVVLDCWYGELPWKSLSNSALNPDGTRKTPDQRWKDVLDMKDRLLGPFVCERAAEGRSSRRAYVDWLVDSDTDVVTHRLPVTVQTIFHQLHSSTVVEYDEVHRMLDALIEIVQDDASDSNRDLLSLREVLSSHHRRERDEQEELAAEERRIAAENESAAAAAASARRAQEKRDAALSAAAAANQAKLEAAKQAAAKAAAAAATPQRTTSSSSHSQLTSPRLSVASGLPAAVVAAPPRAFSQLTPLVRILLGRALHLDWQLQAKIIDLTRSDSAGSGAILTRDADSFSSSLDRLWQSANWSQVSSAASKGLRIGAVTFEYWNGDWNTLIQGLHSLDAAQCEDLLRHLRAPTTVFPIPMQPTPIREMIKVAVPAAVAFVYNTMQKMRRGVAGATSGAMSTSLRAALPAKSLATPPKTTAPSLLAKTTGTAATARRIPKKVIPGADVDASAPALVTSQLPAAAADASKSSSSHPAPSRASTSSTAADKKSIAAIKQVAAKGTAAHARARKAADKKKAARSSSSDSSSDSSSSSSSSGSSDSSETDDSSEDELLVSSRSSKVLPTKKTVPSKSLSSKSSQSSKLPKSASVSTSAAAPKPWKKKAFSDDEPDSDESDADGDADSSPRASATPTAESDSESDSDAAADRGRPARGPENKRTLKVKALREMRTQRTAEASDRLAHERKLRRIQSQAQAEAKRRTLFEEEKRRYRELEEALLKRFGASSTGPSLIPSGEMSLPRVFFLPLAERRAEAAAEREAIRRRLYVNINTPVQRELDLQWEQQQIEQRYARDLVEKEEKQKLAAEKAAEKKRALAEQKARSAEVKAARAAEKAAASKSAPKQRVPRQMRELAALALDPTPEIASFAADVAAAEAIAESKAAAAAAKSVAATTKTKPARRNAKRSRSRSRSRSPTHQQADADNIAAAPAPVTAASAAIHVSVTLAVNSAGATPLVPAGSIKAEADVESAPTPIGLVHSQEESKKRPTIDRPSESTDGREDEPAFKKVKLERIDDAADEEDQAAAAAAVAAVR